MLLKEFLRLWLMLACSEISLNWVLFICFNIFHKQEGEGNSESCKNVNQPTWFLLLNTSLLMSKQHQRCSTVLSWHTWAAFHPDLIGPHQGLFHPIARFVWQKWKLFWTQLQTNKHNENKSLGSLASEPCCASVSTWLQMDYFCFINEWKATQQL